jgi:hypothetical protein
VCPRRYRQGRTCAAPPALEPEAVAAPSSCWRRKSSLNRARRLRGPIPELRTSSFRFPKRRPRFACGNRIPQRRPREVFIPSASASSLLRSSHACCFGVIVHCFGHRWCHLNRRNCANTDRNPPTSFFLRLVGNCLTNLPQPHSAPVSVPGRFLCRCGDGNGGSHPFDVEVRCHVFAERWLGEEGSL